MPSTMRQINTHKTDKFNRDHIEVHAVDVAAGEPNKEYLVTVGIRAQTSDQEDEIVGEQALYFQNGSYAGSRPNGMTDEALVAILIDRLQGRKFARDSRELNLAITNFQQGALWLRETPNK